MPRKPARPCKYPGCPGLTTDPSRYCDAHLKLTQRHQDRERGTAAQRGYDARWRRYRKAYLAEHPLCVICLAKEPEVIREATVVDHIVAHKGNPKLFWDPANHQAVCAECNRIKAAQEEGAFGNPRGRGS